MASMVGTLLREILGARSRTRIPEPGLIMTDPDQVEAYFHAGRVDGSMASVYLLNSMHASEVIRPGDTVIDLGCGSGVQLTQIAALNPETRFVGVDLSATMLEKTRTGIGTASLTNVETVEGDMSRLDAFADRSADAVISSVALHHLPDEDALERTFANIARVLRPDGGVYLVDFGQLKAESSIEYFASRSAVFGEAPVFIDDYRASMRAGFSSQTFRRLVARFLGDEICVRRTFAIDFMVTVKSAARCDSSVSPRAAEIAARLTPNQRRDFLDLRRFLGWGGLETPNPFA